MDTGKETKKIVSMQIFMVGFTALCALNSFLVTLIRILYTLAITLQVSREESGKWKKQSGRAILFGFFGAPELSQAESALAQQSCRIRGGGGRRTVEVRELQELFSLWVQPPSRLRDIPPPKTSLTLTTIWNLQATGYEAREDEADRPGPTPTPLLLTREYRRTKNK